MNYKIIIDEQKLKEFIDFLPKLQVNETYYVSLFARSKYCKDIFKMSSDKQQLKRFTSSKEYLLDKLKQLETEVGTYKYKGEPIPQEALATYITINPRNLKQATAKSIKEMVDMITSDKYDGRDPHKVVLSNIQKSTSRKIFMNMDFDGVNIDDIKPMVKTYLNDDCCHYLVTRGGFHLLIKYDQISREYTKNFYKNVTSLPGVDLNDENLLPIPGTYQGGFCPYID